MKSVEVNGIEIFVEEAENYIQINDINGDDLAKLWKPLTEQYPGYDVNLCFRNMSEPKDILAEIGAEVLEDCISMQVTPQAFTPCGDAEITLLKKSDFDEFAALHDTLPDMYWTSRRLWDKWDNWRILVIHTNSKMTGYTMLCLAMRDASMGEIYAVEGDNQTQREALFSAAVRCIFENGKTVAFRVVERDNLNEKAAALAVGFREVGFYTGYHVKCP